MKEYPVITVSVKGKKKSRRRLFRVARWNRLLAMPFDGNVPRLYHELETRFKVGEEYNLGALKAIAPKLAMRGLRYQLIRNDPVTALIRWESKEENKDLGDYCRFLEFKLLSWKVGKRLKLSFRLGVLLSEVAIFILVPLKVFLDDLPVEVQVNDFVIAFKEFCGAYFCLWIDDSHYSPYLDCSLFRLIG